MDSPADILLPAPRTWPWVWTISAVVLSYYLIISIRSYWRLRHFNGPVLAAWSDLWYIRSSISGKAHLNLANVCTQYGSISRVGPNTLVTCDDELFRKMNSVRSGYRKADFYKAFRFDADLENVLSETDNDRHTAMRKRVTPAYSGKENPNLEPDMDVVLWDFIKLVKNEYAVDAHRCKPMDFARKMQYLTLDIITSLALGQPFGYVSNDKDMYDYIHTLQANFPAMTFMSSVPILSRIMRIPAIQRASLPTVKDRVGMGKVKAVSRGIIAQRFGPEKVVREDMTQSFIRHGLSQAEIADESLLQILAGSDTTATVFRSGFIYIISNPAIYARLQKECDVASVPVAEIISSQRAMELPYLTACVKECLRYHPPASGFNPRVVPPQGDTHNGQYLPPGTIIGVSSWKLHRLNTDLYGPDAPIFRPERWLHGSSSPAAKCLDEMEKSLDLVFGYGGHKCLGERIARIELHKVFFELIRRFDWGFWDVMRNGSPTGGVLEENINYGIFMQNGLWVRVEDRGVGGQ